MIVIRQQAALVRFICRKSSHTRSLDSIPIYKQSLPSEKSGVQTHDPTVRDWLVPTYRGEDEDGGGAAGNALVVVVLYLGDVVAEVAAVVHTAVAAKYKVQRNQSELIPVE